MVTLRYEMEVLRDSRQFPHRRTATQSKQDGLGTLPQIQTTNHGNARPPINTRLVRGMRSSFLADADYHHLTQCETLDDVRLNLSETDYGDVLADMNTLIPTGLKKAAVDKVRIIHLRVVNYQCYVIEDGS